MSTTLTRLLVTIGCLFSLAVGASPKSDYMIHCMGCHMSDGAGMPPEVPAFDATLGDIVGQPGGRAYLIQVPGASQSLLNDEQLAKVLNWMLREYVGSELPENFQDITRLEVSQFRPIVLTNPAVVREKLLTREK